MSDTAVVYLNHRSIAHDVTVILAFGYGTFNFAHDFSLLLINCVYSCGYLFPILIICILLLNMFGFLMLGFFEDILEDCNKPANKFVYSPFFAFLKIIMSHKVNKTWI